MAPLATLTGDFRFARQPSPRTQEPTKPARRAIDSQSVQPGLFHSPDRQKKGSQVWQGTNCSIITAVAN
jgi:hypothetical protein